MKKLNLFVGMMLIASVVGAGFVAVEKQDLAVRTPYQEVLENEALVYLNDCGCLDENFSRDALLLLEQAKILREKDPVGVAIAAQFEQWFLNLDYRLSELQKLELTPEELRTRMSKSMALYWYKQEVRNLQEAVAQNFNSWDHKAALENAIKRTDIVLADPPTDVQRNVYTRTLTKRQRIFYSASPNYQSNEGKFRYIKPTR